MPDPTAPVRLWRELLTSFAWVFTQPGFARFAQWVTGTVLADEEHTITQILTSLGLEDRWRVVERFAEYGAFRQESVERQTRRLVETELSPRFAGYRAVALDDTKCHRTSEAVWGVCTFHEPAGRSPNRASTVRAHNWVVAGDLVPGTPWTSGTLTPAEVVAVFAARFRQEDGFRDHKQWLGMEECQAWTKAPRADVRGSDGGVGPVAVAVAAIRREPGGRAVVECPGLEPEEELPVGTGCTAGRVSATDGVFALPSRVGWPERITPRTRQPKPIARLIPHRILEITG